MARRVLIGGAEVAHSFLPHVVHPIDWRRQKAMVRLLSTVACQLAENGPYL